MDFSAPSPAGSSSGSSSDDPLDLNLLLQDDMIQDSPMSADWNQLSSIWHDFPDFQGVDFGNAPMVIDPSMLSKPSIDPNMLSTNAPYDYDFPFTFQSPRPSSLSPSDASGFPRRLSVSSGSDSISSGSESSMDLAMELAQRVREFSGVMMALPTNAVPSSSSSSASSAASTPPPTTPPSDHNGQSLQASGLPAAGTIMMSSRPKTSHTTIERRYRTNLNARIQSLRMAVPALRVLEWNDGTKKSKGTKAKIKADDGLDAIDARGFVDGVKVARKCSKANVLGKAVEYITVLKKREHRLRREQDGLKTLVSSLVGGSALLNAWEREWKDKFGGEEKDEVDGMDEDGGDSDDDDNDEEEERKRKKPKVSAPAPPVSATPLAPGMVPEKRKRGRPRKVVAPPPVVETVAPTAAAPGQAPQYLLATFALFSFFNNPLTNTTTSTSSTHDGVVLGSKPHHVVPAYQSLIQAFHLIVSILVFASILWPFIGRLKSRVKVDALRPVRQDATPSPRLTRTGNLSEALQTCNRGQQGEHDKLKKALNSGGKGDSYEEKSLEQRAWVRLGEICIFNPEKTSFASRLFTIYHLRSHLPWFSASAGDLATLAMLSCPIAKGRSATIWEAARNNGLTQGRGCAYERLVLASVTVEEAAAIVKVAPKESRYTPIGVVACTLVLQRLKKHLSRMFIGSVVPLQLDSDNDSNKEEESRRITVDSARSLGGKIAELGDAFEQVWNGGLVELNDTSAEGLESDIWTLLTAIVMYRRIFPSAVLGSTSSDGVSIMLSPPPSPTLSDHDDGGYRLRTIMGDRVFDDEDIEEARDRVVDMLVVSERRGRGC